MLWGCPHQSPCRRPCLSRRGRLLAVGETVILLHPPLPLVGVSIGMERGRQQNDRTLADGHHLLDCPALGPPASHRDFAHRTRLMKEPLHRPNHAAPLASCTFTRWRAGEAARWEVGGRRSRSGSRNVTGGGGGREGGERGGRGGRVQRSSSSSSSRGSSRGNSSPMD